MRKFPIPTEAIHIPREADKKAISCLYNMDYISLIEPRQQGKTSLINRLIHILSGQNYLFAKRDLSALSNLKNQPEKWYRSLGKWLCRQLLCILEDKVPEIPVDAETWEDFLAAIAEKAMNARKRLVIALDETGAVPSAIATDFFSILRSVYSSRSDFSFWDYLTFVIAGVFNPEDLIKDKSISGWNVDHRIDINDFTFPQTTELVEKLGMTKTAL